jgi:selenoprotein W-related protein
LTGKIIGGFKQKISELKLIPATGGCFEIKLNDELIFSKLASGQFPDELAILEQVQSRLQPKK